MEAKNSLPQRRKAQSQLDLILVFAGALRPCAFAKTVLLIRHLTRPVAVPDFRL